MASFSEIERLALALSERERATLAANLIDSLPDRNSDDGDDDDDKSGPGRFKAVRSSMLRKVRYDPKKRFLDVVFRTGEIYRYKDVPQHVYNELMEAESHGKYMQRHIIDQYETIRLDS